MGIEQLIKTLIFIHAGFGGIALVSGGISMLAKKGSSLHKKSGKIFFYTMLISVLMSLVIAVIPNHKSSFLFCIGLFSAYFIIGGYRSLKFKKKIFSIQFDKLLAYSIIATGTIMILYPILLQNGLNIVLMIFGIIALTFGIIDLLLLRNKTKLRKNWLKMHLSKMISGYVAATTAFIVVNQWLPGVWAWFTPGIFGTTYTIYWLIKLKKKKPVVNIR